MSFIPQTFDTHSIVFSKPRPIAKAPTSCFVNIKALQDGKEEDLTFVTEELFCFGVQPTTELGNAGNVVGYELGVVLLDPVDSPTPEQAAFVDCLNRIASHCRQHLLKIKKEIKKPQLIESDLRNFTCVRYAKDKETLEVIPGKSPTLRLRLYYKNGKISSDFVSNSGRRVDPLTLLGKPIRIRAVIHIRNIFVGNSCALQIYAPEIQVQEPPPRRRFFQVSEEDPDEEQANDQVGNHEYADNALDLIQ